MSNLGKTFLGLALIGAIVALVYGWLLIGNYNTSKTNLVQMTEAKTAADAEAKKQKAAAEAAAQAEQDTQSKLTTATGQVTDLTSQLTAAKSKLDDATNAAALAKTAADKAQSDLDALNKVLNGQSPADLIAARDKAANDAKAAQDEQKILQDQLQASLAQVDQLKKDINASHLGTEPGVSGKVTFVNRTWNFVVLDVGLSNGVVPNGELIVYRGNNFLGKVKVTSVDTNSAVADIMPDTKGRFCA